MVPRPVSGRFLAAHLGVGRSHAASVDTLYRHLPASVSADVAQLYHMRATAQRLQQQLAAHDRQRHLTPKEAGYPVPFLNPQQQQRFRQEAQARKREEQRLLAEANQNMNALYLPSFLRAATLIQKKAPAGTAGADLFKATSFWQSQNPHNDPKVGWALCCATVKAMMEAHYGKGKIPNVRYDLVQEHRSAVWAHGYRVRDYYGAAPDGTRAARGLALLDEYMALHKPVMVGVSHKLNLLFSSKNKKTGLTKYREINDGTIDHFVAIVGTGTDAKGKYYRFFDVGTIFLKKGTDPSNRFYLSKKSGFWEGPSQAMPGKTYVLTQLRFF